MNDDASTYELPEYIHSRLQPQIHIEFPEHGGGSVVPSMATAAAAGVRLEKSWGATALALWRLAWPVVLA